MLSLVFYPILFSFYFPAFFIYACQEIFRSLHTFYLVLGGTLLTKVHLLPLSVFCRLWSGVAEVTSVALSILTYPLRVGRLLGYAHP